MNWRQRESDDLSEEIEQHIAERAEELIREGVSAKQAFQTARKEFGNVTLVREQSREIWGGQFVEALLSDLRYAVRQLRKAPGFALAMVLTLALAIGANTAIFSVVRAVLLKPLPYKESARLLCVWHGDAGSYSWYTFSYPRFIFFQRGVTDVAELAAYDDEIVTLTDRREPVRLEGGRVSANFFPLLGIKPELGRVFLPSEDRHGATAIVLLSDRLWRERYHADRKVIGQTVGIDGEDSTIIGVVPREFQFQGGPIDVWRSRIVDTRTFAPSSVQLGASYLTVVARLHPGVALSQLQARLTVANAQYSAENPGNSDVLGPVSADFLQRKLFARMHETLLVLWGAVICLLAIACANVANLVLARSIVRSRDIRVRFALGASRWRITQQLITENVFLALCSMFAALPLSLWGMRALSAAFDLTSPALPAVRLDLGVMLFSIGLATTVGVAFGLMPMWTFLRGEMQTGVGREGRSFSASKWSTQFRNGIVAAQVALCLMLLAAAGLLTQSFVRMSTMNTGLRADHILISSLDLMPSRYDLWRKRSNFYDEVLQRVETIPGVRGAAIASRMDLVGSGLGYLIQVDGSPKLGSENPSARGRSVSPTYFNLVGIPLLRGRMFTEHDTSSSTPVMVVNEAFARKYFPGTDPIGRHVTYSTDRISCQVVGVVGNVRSGLQDTGVEDELYLPLSQRPWLVAKLLVRTNAFRGIAATIRNRVQSVDPGQAVADSVPLEQEISREMGRPRTTMLVVMLFALSALLLAAVGIYGVIAYSVAQRRKEIGIRMALGANSNRVRALVFGQTARLLVIGMLIGLPLAMMLSRLYVSLLFAVEPSDPATFACVDSSAARRKLFGDVSTGHSRCEDRSGGCAANRLSAIADHFLRRKSVLAAHLLGNFG